MSETAEFDVAHVAKLARLNLTEAEITVFRTQLGRVLQYARKLQELDTAKLEDAAHAVPIFDVFREDEPRPWLGADEALSNAPRQSNGLFVVPKVLG